MFLRTLSASDQARWDRVLGYLTFAYCHGICRTTGQAPHFLEQGRDLRGRQQYQVQLPRMAPIGLTEYLARLRARFKAA
jgi:hypothetical protein